MTPDDPRHGTNAGHRAHFTHGTEPCQPCRDAHAAYRRNLWRKKYLRRVDTLLVDSRGTIRRVRALQAIGYRLVDIDLALGYSGRSNAVHNLCRQDFVRRDTAERVAAIYERLCMTPGPCERSRRIATKRGWAPPLAWDCIDTDDEPHGMGVTHLRRDLDENVVTRVLAGEWRMHTTPAEKAEIARRWVARGGSAAQLAGLTGWRVERYYRVGEGGAA